MRLALISDIHGNLEALEAVLHDIGKHQVNKVHCLGDVVGYGCDPAACLRLVESHCEIKLLGNHEYAVLGLLASGSLNQLARCSLDWTAEQMTDREFSMIADFELDTVCADCYLVHGSPFEPEEWHYILSNPEAKKGFRYFDQRIAFFGHTHVPMIYSQLPDGAIRSRAGHDFDPDDGETRYLVNIGSVGQPRDNDPRACYAIFDSDRRSVTYRRVTYDIKKAQAKMAEAKMPQMLIERLEAGR